MTRKRAPIKLDLIYSSYKSKVASGELSDEAAQYPIIQILDELRSQLINYRLGRKSSSLGWLFAKKTEEKPKGLYIWGSVGRGKTMLMDLFYSHSTVKRKKRIHFHEFMRDIHKRLHEIRQNEDIQEDAVALVIEEISNEAWLLCFDEFVVTDIADAMIMARLFEGLYKAGVIVVATSNTAPDDLYKNGLQRERFLPFIDILKENMKEVTLDHETDYRGEFESAQDNYIFPISYANRQKFKERWKAFCKANGNQLSQQVLDIQGREWYIDHTCNEAALLSFDILCREPRGAIDYLVLAEKFDLIFISDVPKFRRHERNEARRFILLIDALYDLRKKIIILADVEPNHLYTEGDHATEFERTVSRLTEMQSEEYFNKF